MHVEVLLALRVVAGKVLPRVPRLPVVRGALQRPHAGPRTVGHGYGDVGDLEKLEVKASGEETCPFIKFTIN